MLQVLRERTAVFQRPRRVGAKFTGTNIAPDEHVQPQLMFDYDGKRDRWNGYNPEEHMKIVEEYAKVDLVSQFPAVQRGLGLLPTPASHRVDCTHRVLGEVRVPAGRDHG